MSKRNIYKKASKESAEILYELESADESASPPILPLEVDMIDDRQSLCRENDEIQCDEKSSADSDDSSSTYVSAEELIDIDWEEIDALFRSDRDDSQQVNTSQSPNKSKPENVLPEEDSLSDDLRFYYAKFHPSREGMNFLLKSLKKHGVNVPSSVHMLRKQSGKYKWNSQTVNNGKIAYISIVENLKFLVSNKLIEFDLTQSRAFPLHLKINIDGLPLFSGSNYQLWPILMLVNGYERPLPLGLFGGVGKPDIGAFIGKLCDEIKHLQENGCEVDKVRFSLEKIIFICDSPARSYVQCINPHNAYYGCGYCRTKGEYHHNRIVFPQLLAVDRTDTDYSDMKENNQSSQSPLIGIVPLMSAFPPEYMHLVLLGVMKKIMFYTFFQVKGCQMKSRLSSAQIENISCDLMNISKFIPSEFQRKFYKGFKEIIHFKATEYRTLLLYIGPFIFQPYMKPEIYNHFMLLSFGIYCFVSERYHEVYHANAKACLMNFIQLFPSLYDLSGVTYNVHVLQHLPDYVSHYGPLDKFSSFQFENYLGVLKRRIKASSNIFEQSLNRMMDIRTSFQNNQVRKLRFSDKAPDNCAVLEDGRIVIVLSVTNNLISGQVLKFARNLFSDPYPSKFLHIGYYSLSRLKVRNVLPMQKCILIPKQNEFLVIPIC